MSERTVGVDPRFDARFQRGYVAPVGYVEPEPERVAVPAPARVPTQVPASGASPRDPVPDELDVSADAGHAPRRLDDTTSPDAELLSWLDDPEARAPSADPWFLAAWGIAVLAAALGLTLTLAGIVAENPYSAPVPSDRWLQVLSWTVAPALLQAGVLCVVAMLVWTGLRHVRRAAADDGGRL